LLLAAIASSWAKLQKKIDMAIIVTLKDATVVQNSVAAAVASLVLSAD